MVLSRGTIRSISTLFLLPAAAALAFAQAPFNDQSSGVVNARAIAFNPVSRKVFAVDTDHSTVHVIDTATQSARSVKVGSEPVSLDVDTATGRVYVANAGDGTVTILDAPGERVVTTVPVGARPYSIAVDSVAHAAYVSHTFSDKTTVLDGNTQAVTQLTTGSIDLIALDPAAARVYLLGYEGGNLTILEGPGHAQRKAQAGKHAWGMAVNETTHTLYVARMGTGDVFALREGASSVLPAGNTPCAVAVNPLTNTVLVANYSGANVSILDGATGRTLATVPVGEHPQALAVDAQRNLVYVANTFSHTVTVIDAAARKAIATLPAGKAPYALAVAPGSEHVYAANGAGETSFTVVR
jgi:YVTN family beta-propeller protein